MAQRVAVVTGGMGGLGEAICLKLAAMGNKVVATYSPGNTKSAEWLKEMKAKGHDLRAVQVDVADFDSCQKAVTEDPVGDRARSTCSSTTPASRAT